MRRRILVQALLSMGLLAVFMVLTAPKAYADNCGSLSDCFQMQGSAASVIAGVAVIITIAVLALPSLLEITKSTPAPPRSDRDREPQQPAAPPESAPDSRAQVDQQRYAPAQHPEHQPERFADEETGRFPERQPVHHRHHHPEHPDERHPEHPEHPEHPTEPHPEHPDEPHPEHPTEPHPEEPTVRPSWHPAVQAPDRPPVRMTEHPAAPPNQQPQVPRSDQQPQITRPDEQIQVVRRVEPAPTPDGPLVEPPVRSLLYGIHHVTAIAGNPQQNIDFYTGLLGLRLVKLTVNFDNPNTYHLYYGDELGRPGTILSFFAWPGAAGGSRGSGQAVALAFSIPEGTLNYWAEYLRGRGIRVVQPPAHFDEQMFSFYDPDGLQIDMVAHRDTGMYPARSGGPIPPAYAIRGIYGVTLLEANNERTHAFLTEVLGFSQVKVDRNRFRYAVGDGGPGAFLDVLSFPGIPPGQAALGTIHHLAWRTPGDEQQLALQQRLTNRGFNPTQWINRLYYSSYAFREPGGVIFEIASSQPGFTFDEPPEQLGTHLMLPPWLANRRGELQQVLPPLRLPPFIGR